MLRAEAYAATQDWEKAAADLVEAIKLGPRMTSGYQRLSIVRLKQGQPAQYREQCAKMLDLLKDDDSIGGPVAWACSLRENAVPDPEVPVQAINRVLADRPGSYVLLNTAGAALYRAGHLQEAIDILGQSRVAYTRAAGLAQLSGDPDAVLTPIQDGRPVDWLFLAMAQAKLGAPQQAQEWLKKSAAAITSKSVTDPRRTWARLELEILLEEANALIQTPKP
jgi:tetratricopeptide (TPR) repeat protein